MRSLVLVVLASVVAGACGDNIEASWRDDYDACAYALEARFDWDRQRLIAREDITVIAKARRPIVLDAEVAIARVHADGSDLSYEVDQAERTLRVDLSPLAPGDEQVTFTVEYEAPLSRALVIGGPRDDDPVPSRVVYSNSEPIYGSKWLVAKHDPDDRALWSVALDVAADEDAVANGQRLADEVRGDRRIVRYEMDRPLPTYLMAFAAGQLVHEDRETGRVPLSLWHRRGLSIDPARNLDMVADAMATFEARLGPYPWDSYAVVLLPGFSGGMENATITFNSEASGLGNGSFALNAHELAHHWFGDWVTMRTYDDVWVKEGMATLLAAEATRARRDRAGSGRLFATDFDFRPDDRIVDPALTGIAKYTSGPYERAAWLITQIRARVGEEAFWQALRDVLDEHALDSVDGESFVRSFAPALDEATIQRILASLDELPAPTITVETRAVAGGTEVAIAASDPAAVLIEPFAVAVIDATGAATPYRLEPDAPLTVVVPSGGYLAPDEREVHPPWDRSFQADGFAAIAPLLVPSTSGALTAFLAGSPSQQERAIAAATLDAMTPGDIGAVVTELDSTRAGQGAVVDGCTLLAQADDPAPWLAALAPLVTAPPEQRFDAELGLCGAILGAQAIEPELAARLAAPTPDVHGRLEYLASFDLGAARSLALLGQLATGAPTLALRDLALTRLAYQARGLYYTPVPADERDAWRAFFRGRLATTTSAGRLRTLWLGVYGLEDTGALPAVAGVLRAVRPTASLQEQIVCDAYRMTRSDETAWQAFRQALQSWSDLATEAGDALGDPSQCR